MKMKKKKNDMLYIYDILKYILKFGLGLLVILVIPVVLLIINVIEYLKGENNGK